MNERGEKKRRGKAQKKSEASPPPPPSALHVRPGVPGGHAGLPGGKPLSARAEAERWSTRQYVEGVRAGDRTALGRAITLIESGAPSHQVQAQEVLTALLPHARPSIRVGVTGTPGAGKSSLIDALGSRLTDRGMRVAVMAVDPSSSISKGSILGDKTRMENLSRSPLAFIRPSPTGGTLGGVARKTRETMRLFEAAGFEVLFVETVGVGQSEITVRSMVDFFLLLLVPGGGDELQGIKRGVMELADAVVIHKADGAMAAAAQGAKADYSRALEFLRPATEGWKTPVLLASSRTGEGVDAIWETIERFRIEGEQSGVLERRRSGQALEWLHQLIEERLKGLFYGHPAVTRALPDLERRVKEGSTTAVQAAWDLLALFHPEAPGGTAAGKGPGPDASPPPSPNAG